MTTPTHSGKPLTCPVCTQALRAFAEATNRWSTAQTWGGAGKRRTEYEAARQAVEPAELAFREARSEHDLVVEA
jgi:hypothetical protein